MDSVHCLLWLWVQCGRLANPCRPVGGACILPHTGTTMDCRHARPMPIPVQKVSRRGLRQNCVSQESAPAFLFVWSLTLPDIYGSVNMFERPWILLWLMSAWKPFHHSRDPWVTWTICRLWLRLHSISFVAITPWYATERLLLYLSLSLYMDLCCVRVCPMSACCVQRSCLSN
jgi:hypothetical protein